MKPSLLLSPLLGLFLLLVAFAASSISGLTPQFPVNTRHQSSPKKNDMEGAGRSSGVEGPARLHAIVERDGKGMVAIPTSVFLLVSGVVLPFWAAVLVPLTITYQLGLRPLFRRIGAVLSNDDGGDGPVLDTGYVVDERDVVPRPERRYDVVLLGATGFTGRLMCRHMIKTYGCGGGGDGGGVGLPAQGPTTKAGGTAANAAPPPPSVVRWAIAGRNQRKLDSIKKSLAEELDRPDAMNIDTIIVDTAIPDNLPALVKDTRVVVTTAGPFTLYGTSVVEFCAKFGTHYCDITGEVSFVQTMMNQWEDTAKRTGAKLIHFCGNDCVPWDLSLFKVAEAVEQQGLEGEELASISFLDELVGDVSGGTLLTTREAIAGKMLPDPVSDPFLKTAHGERLSKSPLVDKLSWLISKLDRLPWNGKAQAYTSPFVMSVANLKVLSWTHALFGRTNTPLAYSEALISPDFQTAFVSYAGLIVLGTAMLNPVSGYFLFKYLLPKPGEGPSLKKMEETNFLAVYAQGKGTMGTKVDSLMYFPKDSGYYETSRMVVECGLSLALQEGDLPITKNKHTGGFFSPAYGLGQVLLDRLVTTGTKFDLIVQKPEAQQ